MMQQKQFRIGVFVFFSEKKNTVLFLFKKTTKKTGLNCFFLTRFFKP